MITLNRQETDEEYHDRTESILKAKNIAEKKKQKQKDIEYQTYLKLKEKFEEKE